MVPPPTATRQPPPTVTPFPTATPGGEAVNVPDADPTAEETESTGENETPDAVTTEPPAASPTATEASPSASLPEGVQIVGSPLVFAFDTGWPTLDDDRATIGIIGGDYVFNITNDARRYVNSGYVDQENLYLELDVLPESCPDTSSYGLYFRFQDTDNYYALNFFCQNRITVHVRSLGVLITPPLVDTTLPDGLDASSPETHTIGLLTRGEEIAIYFDNEEIARFTDGTHTEGDIALYATAQSFGIIVRFEHLEIWNVR
jgi:hypothetical protein